MWLPFSPWSNFTLRHFLNETRIYKHCLIEIVYVITSCKAVVLPVIYKWKSAVKIGGIRTGKTMNSSGKTVVIPLISSVISVDNMC